MFKRIDLRVPASCLVILTLAWPAVAGDTPWKRHTIDNSSRGADGVRLADVNGDGVSDITTGWEEGGVIRVYLHPGHAKAKEKWPAVTIGKVKSPEDAVFADLDGDGAMDVVSSCEGGTRTMYVHWAPKDKSKYLDESAWKTEPIPATQGVQMWMYALPMQVDGKGGIDLIVSSKGGNACVGWLESPAPGMERDLSQWKLHRIRDAGWIMSLIATDMDGDGQDDVLFSDRKGKASGVYWLKLTDRAKAAEASAWKEHTIGAVGEEVMFIAREQFVGDETPEVIAVTKPNVARWFKAGKEGQWEPCHLLCDTDRFGRVKAVRAADMLGTGRSQFVITCEGAEKEKSGVYLVDPRDPLNEPTRFIDIGGPEGVKYDRIELIDLDGDGDLDVLTCEERDNLGVIWYENPGKGRARG